MSQQAKPRRGASSVPTAVTSLSNHYGGSKNYAVKNPNFKVMASRFVNDKLIELKLQKRDKSIFISHILVELEHYSDKTLIIKSEQILHSGNRATIIHKKHITFDFWLENTGSIGLFLQCLTNQKGQHYTAASTKKFFTMRARAKLSLFLKNIVAPNLQLTCEVRGVKTFRVKKWC